MEICTIGTSGITAERFFRALSEAKVTHLVDTRLHASSQLAGYAKQDSLIYFLDRILGIGYKHEPMLAPTDNILKEYRNKIISWDNYAERYISKLDAADLLKNLDLSEWGSKPVLLCSETKPDFCHRRLAADYLEATFPLVQRVVHLGI